MNTIILLCYVPQYDPQTGYLPQGIHIGSWTDITERFGQNRHRRWLLAGLYDAIVNLVQAGCRKVLLDGSFITTKPFPNDYDAVWEPKGVDPKLLDPVLLDYSNSRAAMKAKFGGVTFRRQF